MTETPNKFIAVLTWLIAALWLVHIGLDYYNKHPGYYYAFTYFKYTGLILSYVAAFCIIGMAMTMGFLDPLKKILTPAFLILPISIIFWLIVHAHRNYSMMETDFGNQMVYVGRGLQCLGYLYVLYLILGGFGGRVLTMMFDYIKPSRASSIAVGVMCYTIMMFLLAAVGFLKMMPLLLVLLIFLAIGYKDVLTQLKDFLLKPVDVDKLNFLGFCSIAIAVFLLSVNFLSNQLPFPTGFDSRNFYANISRTLDVSGSLVEGYQPYNWSIFMSLGHIVFHKVEMVLSISFSAFILFLFAFYELAKKHLQIEKNKALFVCAILCATPSIVNQLFIELKVDFGLLFFQAVTLICFFQYYLKDREGKPYKAMVLIGALLGFGLGIKLINMFMLFTLVGILWWPKRTSFGLIGILCLSLSFLLLAGIDELSGLKTYHLSPNTTSLISALIGLGLLGIGFIKERKTVVKNLVMTLFLGLGSGVLFAPWMVKNIKESNGFSVKNIVMGATAGPKLNAEKIVGNYRRKKAQEAREAAKNKGK